MLINIIMIKKIDNHNKWKNYVIVAKVKLNQEIRHISNTWIVNIHTILNIKYLWCSSPDIR